MNLYARLLFRRLCNEQQADGGAAPAASEPAVSTGAEQAQGETSQQEGNQAEGQQQDKAEQNADPNAQQQKTEAELSAEREAAEKAEKDKKPEGAPEKYEFKAGEGFELDQEALKDFEPLAREMNLTNEQAQKMVDLYSGKILPMVQKQQAEAWQKQTEGWAESVKADKEIGGDKLTSSISTAQRALETFGSPELKEYLNTTGLGNHPELIKVFVKVGKAMSEDGMVTGKESGQRTAAEVLYGK